MPVSELQRVQRRCIRLTQPGVRRLVQLRARSASSRRSRDAACSFSVAQAPPGARGLLSPPSATLPAQDDLSGGRTLQPRHERRAALGANDAGRPASAQLLAQPVPLLGIVQPLLHDLSAAPTAAAHGFLIGGVEPRFQAYPRTALAKRPTARCSASQFDGGFVVWDEVLLGGGAKLGAGN